MSAMTPFDQAQAYVGTAYEPGVFDCADLAVRVQAEVFGRQVGLPQQRVRPGGARGQAREIRRLQMALASRIDGPLTGCGVLMFERQACGLLLWHIGTVFVQAGAVWVLHNSAKLGSAALQRLEDLVRFGLRVDGYYAWKDGTA